MRSSEDLSWAARAGRDKTVSRSRIGTRLRFAILAAVAASSLGVLSVGGSVSAGTDGQSPNACTGNSSPVGQTALVQGGVTRGYVELRFSTGCGVAWARVCRANSTLVNLHQIYRSQPAGHTYSTSNRAGTNEPGTCANGFGAATAHSYAAIDSNCTALWGAACSATAYGRISVSGSLSNTGASGPY